MIRHFTQSFGGNIEVVLVEEAIPHCEDLERLEISEEWYKSSRLDRLCPYC